MGIEMDYAMETPLDVLSRAAIMIQNEEREAALKRSVDTQRQAPRSVEYDQPCKRLRESPPPPPPYPHNSPSTSHTESRKCTSTQRPHTSNHEAPSSFPPSYSSQHITSSQQHTTSSENGRSTANQNRSSQQPWQPFANEHAHPSYKLSSLPAHLPLPDRVDNNLPLNLTVPSAHARTASVPRASIIAQATSRGEDSSSPGVPEKVAGRRVMTYNGMVFYPTPVHGASLPNMEAKTQRDVDSDTCDPAIEEHFRRSLGNAYPEYMCRSSSASPRTPTPPRCPSATLKPTGGDANMLAESQIKLVTVSGTVDEHFAKALGKQTWKQIQVQTEAEEDNNSVDDHFTKALGDTWLRIKAGRDVNASPHTHDMSNVTQPQ